MRGSDPVITYEFYQSTAKSMEGYLAGVLFEKAKEEECTIEINWQDQDSSSEKSFRAVYTSETSSSVMKCGGHVGRAHVKALKDLKSKEFDTGYIVSTRSFLMLKSCLLLQREETFSKVWLPIRWLQWVSTTESVLCNLLSVATMQLLLLSTWDTLVGTMHKVSTNGTVGSAIFTHYLFGLVVSLRKMTWKERVPVDQCACMELFEGMALPLLSRLARSLSLRFLDLRSFVPLSLQHIELCLFRFCAGTDLLAPGLIWEFF